MKKRILSMMLCCFMLFGMIVIVSADSTTPDHTRAGCDAVWSESFEGFEAGATDLPSGWKKGDKTDTYVYTANSTTTRTWFRITVKNIFVCITNLEWCLTRVSILILYQSRPH